MGIKVAWDDPENRIIRYDLEGMWNWEDYRDAVSQSAQMMQSVNYPVGIIANFTADTMLPKGSDVRKTSAVPQSKMNTMPENMGVVVITGGYGFVEVMINGFCKLYNRVERKFVVANTLDEARRLVGEKLANTGHA
jgi:hypothetical protein